MSNGHIVADFNDLVRQAQHAQELFDNWDEGMTFTSGPFGEKRQCPFDEICQEWDSTNLKLVTFVLEHADHLQQELGQRDTK
jgi:hypothetical protein